jgi:2-haloacid dehalogenase
MDTLLHLGHGGYLETVRRALVYVLALNGLPRSEADAIELMQAWPHLRPFPEVGAALERLDSRYRLVVLSNGDPEFLAHLVRDQVGWGGWEQVISVERVGHFKPHPAVYRRAAHDLRLEVGECLMVSANSFDVVGARANGLRAAFVNRNRLPYDDRPFLPDVTVEDFTQLADTLL